MVAAYFTAHFWRPFVKRFALCYQTIVCLSVPSCLSVLSVCIYFVTLVYCGQTAGCINMPLGTEVCFNPGDFVLDEDPAPSPKWERSQFSPHVYCGRTAGCIKMPLGMKVGLSSGDFVGSSPLPKQGAEPPNFRPMSIVAKYLNGSRCHLVWR